MVLVLRYPTADHGILCLLLHVSSPCLQEGPLQPCSVPAAPMSASAASSALSGKVLQTDGKQLAQLLLRLSELQVRISQAGWLTGW
jgi:hypothetical protein